MPETRASALGRAGSLGSLAVAGGTAEVAAGAWVWGMSGDRVFGRQLRGWEVRWTSHVASEQGVKRTRPNPVGRYTKRRWPLVQILS